MSKYIVSYNIIEKLPKLAWLADIDVAMHTVKVYAGPNVECHETFFVSGVWDGNFMDAGFDSSSVFYGTGAKIGDNSISFFTPSHALERIILNQDKDRIIVSNSVPFIMAFAEVDLDYSIDQYEKIFCSILKGPTKLRRFIPMDGGKELQQFIVGCVTIDESGNISYRRRDKVADFVNFDDYYGRMMTAMRAVYANASSSDRVNTKFGLCTTISSGYDSTANAAVARQLGCNTALGLSGGIFDEDDGTKVALELGYTEIIRRDHLLYRDKSGCIDAEYISSGEISKHQQFSVFEDVFADRIVFMGTRGDYFWGLNSVANNDFEMIGFFYNETDISFTENALKNGYILLPLATYGTTASVSIQAISHSDEMKPWRLNTEYDRPIPRRIAESVGASRESFGHKKRGGGFSFCYDTIKTLKRKMSVEGYKSFTEFRKLHKPINTFRKYCNAVRFWIAFSPSYMNRLARNLRINISIKQKVLNVVNPFIASELLFWAIHYMKDKYRDSFKDVK